METDSQRFAGYLKLKNRSRLLHWLPFILMMIVGVNLLVFGYFLYQQDPNLADADVVTQQTTRNIKASDELKWFANDERLYVNRYDDPNGRFHFEYSTDYEVRRFNGVTYLANISTGGVVFHVFPAKPTINFSHDFSVCSRLTTNDVYCFQLTDENAVQNLVFLPTPAEINEEDLKKMSRAETLALVMQLRWPDEDFSSHKGACFNDIDAAYKFSGEICFAKERGYVVGIDGKFYPEQSVTVLAVLKLLYLSYNVQDYTFNSQRLDDSLFENMQTIHPSYNHIAKAVYEGILLNPDRHTYWPNQPLNGKEVFDIIHRFILWNNGHALRTFHSGNYTELVQPISFLTDEPVFTWHSRASLDKEGEKLDVLPDPARKRLNGRIVDHLWVELGDLNTRQLIMDWDVWLDWDRKQGWARAKRKDGSVENAELVLNSEWVRAQLSDDSIETQKLLTAMQLLPPKLRGIQENTLPTISVDLDPNSLESIIHYRGSDRRYPALVTWHYPDGTNYERPAVVKSRGNANRSFVKTNYTIEFFDDLKDNPDFVGDEWLKDHNEIKLRGFVNEPSQLREKLYYRLFQAMGQVAPDFFEAKLMVNGMPLGLYHITEPVKDDFFKRRDMDVNDYYYARNSDSEQYANLTFYVSDQNTLELYKIDGSNQKLLRLIDRLRVMDETLIDEIDVRSVFTYAFITYLTDAADSLVHNYYVYYDEKTRKWKMMPWDADETFLNVKDFYANDLKRTMKNQTGLYNQLIYYVYQNMSQNEFYDEWIHAQEQWNSNVDLEQWISAYKEKLTPYLLWDNELWNEVFLGRKMIHMNAMSSIDHLNKTVKSIQVLN